MRTYLAQLLKEFMNNKNKKPKRNEDIFRGASNFKNHKRNVYSNNKVNHRHFFREEYLRPSTKERDKNGKTRATRTSLARNQVEIIINGNCCEKLPDSMLEKSKEERIWLIPKKGQLERLVEKSIIEDSLWILELSDNAGFARVIVKDGIIIEAKMERGSAVYKGKAAITMIDSLAGPVNLKISRLRGFMIEKDPLANYLFGKGVKGIFKEIAGLRSTVIDLLSSSYEALTDMDAEKLCRELSKLHMAFEKLFKVEEKVLEKNASDKAPLSGHKFEHALILKGLSDLRMFACIKNVDLESILVKFLRVIDDIKVHFSQRDVEVYRKI